MPTWNPSVSLGSGIRFTEIQDAKFKTACALYIRLYLTRCPEKAAVRSLVIDLLTDSNADYPTLASLSLRKQYLYGTSISSVRSNVGDVQSLTISTVWLDDRFSLDGQSITDKVLDLTLGCLLRPNVKDGAFDKASFKFAKQNLLDTIDCEINQKRSYALQKGAEFAFAGEPAACPPYGTRESAEQITPQSAYEAWKEMLETAQIEIVAITPEQKPMLRQRLSEAFAALSNRNPLPIVFENPSPCKPASELHEEPMPVSQCKMVLVMKSADADHDAMRMLNLILGGTTGSLLFANVREKLSLCYYCASRYQRSKHALTIDCGVRTDKLEEAKAAILEQVAMLTRGEFTDDHMNEAILFQSHAYATAADAPSGLATWVFSQKETNRNITMEESLEALRNVTREQVIEAAKKLSLDTVYILRATLNDDEEDIAE